MAFERYEPLKASPLVSAVDWMAHLLTGTLGTSIAVLAIGWAGVTMMQGRLSIREGTRVVLGCFILFGAPLIARGLIDTVRGDAMARHQSPQPAPVQTPKSPPQFDPYAGAALPR